MSDWKECTLSDLGTIVGGATPSTKDSSNYEKGTIAWITPKDLSTHTERFISFGERNITEKGLKSCSAQIMPKNSVLFTSRAPIGYVAISSNECCTNQGFKSIVPNENTDFMFLYYLLKFNKDNIENMGSGTTFKEVSGNTMKNIKVKVPANKSEQSKIAAVLSSLDEKIELNNRINDNLEQQAQAIFKSWFVDFEPFDGKMPEGWRVGKLSEIADIIMGQSPDGKSYNEDGIGTVFYQGRAEFGTRFPTRRLFTKEPKRIAKKFDTLMSVRAPVGDLNIANEDCCIGRGLAAIHSKDSHQSFIHYTVAFLHPQLDVFNGEGTVFGCINRDALNNMEVLIPSKPDLDKFEQIVAALDNDIFNRTEENRNLVFLRDTLLPKLMSGEIDVNSVQV